MPVYQSRIAGIYRARYVGCVEKNLVDQETGEEKTLFLWRFQDVNDPLTTGEISKFTSTNMQNTQANAHIMATGIMGRKLQAGDDTETRVGELYDVVYGPNRAGNLTITSVVRVQEAENPVLPTEAEKAQTELVQMPLVVVSPAELP